MTMTKALAAGAALAVLGACVPQGPDTTPPAIQMSQGSTVFFASQGSGTPSACPGGVRDAYAGAGTVHARSGGASVRMTVTFTDPAGLKRAYLQIPNGTLRSPEVSRTVQVPTPDGNLSQAYEYNFFGDEAAPPTTHSVTVDLSHSDTNRVFNAFAIDANDNRSATASVVVGEASRICG